MKASKVPFPQLRGSVRLQRRSRPGFTLLEAVVTITMAAILISGGIMFVVGAQEQMHIYRQTRLADEWGNWYLDQFVFKMRNGRNHDLVREAPPSRLTIITDRPEDIIGPYEPYGLEPEEVEWQFEYSPAKRLPVIRKGRVIQRQNFFPPVGNPRDDFYVKNRDFVMETFEGYDNDPTIEQELRDNIITMKFTLHYDRYAPLDDSRRGVYQKVLEFERYVYVVNNRWATQEAPI
ncbi:hypothetical protein GF324_02865 [bacterium]|nr:hypothetical protein [bacterium]